MRLLSNEKEWDGGRTAVAFGTFDGVHLGHQKLMAEAVRLADENRLCIVAYSYSTHPMQAFNPDRVPLQLETSVLLAGGFRTLSSMMRQSRISRSWT